MQNYYNVGNIKVIQFSPPGFCCCHFRPVVNICYYFKVVVKRNEKSVFFPFIFSFLPVNEIIRKDLTGAPARGQT